jgi:putative membrane protein
MYPMFLQSRLGVRACRIMPTKLKKFIASWLINTLAVLIAVSILPGIHYDKLTDLFVASLLLGILNAFLRPIILLLALPLLIFTLGLFIFVVNALLLYFVGWLLQPHFYIDSFMSAFWGAIIIGVVSLVLNLLTGSGGSRVEFRRSAPEHGGRDDSGGPVIDV